MSHQGGSANEKDFDLCEGKSWNVAALNVESVISSYSDFHNWVIQ